MTEAFTLLLDKKVLYECLKAQGLDCRLWNIGCRGQLAGRHVVLVLTRPVHLNFSGGFNRLIEEILPLTASCRYVFLDPIPESERLEDWLAQAPRIIDEIMFMARETDVFRPERPPLVLAGCRQIMEAEVPRRSHIVDPVLPRQGLAMIHAARGVGKTYFALSLALAAAAGQGPVFSWSVPGPSRALYIDGEMPLAALKERLRAFKPDPACYERLDFITPDFQPPASTGLPNLAQAEGQEALEPYLDYYDFIILDNLATLCRGGQENDAEHWASTQKWLLELRRLGKTVLLVHHSGKSGDQRGSSAREDILDTVIKLSRPSDYRSDEGARVLVEITKARAFSGAAAEPFEARLFENHERLSWEIKRSRELDLSRVRNLVDFGLSQRQIAERLGLSRGVVSRLLGGR